MKFIVEKKVTYSLSVFIRNMNVLKVVKISSQALSILCSLLAISLTLASMVTSRWLVAEFSTEEIYQHGILKDCEKTPTKNNLRSAHDWLCFWKFDQSRDLNGRPFDELKNWQVAVLALLSTACGIAFIASVCICLSKFIRLCSVPWVVCSSLAALLSMAGVITFFKHAVERENRFFRLEGREVDQQYGFSFYICLAGCILFIVSSVFAFIGMIAIFFESRRNVNDKASYQMITHHTTKV